jgi:hypothetical protein
LSRPPVLLQKVALGADSIVYAYIGTYKRPGGRERSQLLSAKEGPQGFLV